MENYKESRQCLLFIHDQWQGLFVASEVSDFMGVPNLNSRLFDLILKEGKKRWWNCIMVFWGLFTRELKVAFFMGNNYWMVMTSIQI